MKRYIAAILLSWILLATNTFAQLVDIPDPNLRKAIREQLALADGIPITKAIMENLTALTAWSKNIQDLTGLEYAIHLNHLSLRSNQIQDLTPLTNLIKLRELMLNGNPVTDLTPLSNLINLRRLGLTGCQHITDISPLQNLVNLRQLFIRRTPINDFSAIEHLNLIDFEYDQPCDMPPQLPSVRDRIESRTFPSIFQPWANIVNLEHLTWDQRNALHDLHWSAGFSTKWYITETETHKGLATSLIDIYDSQETRRQQLDRNPNMIFIRGFPIVTSNESWFPSDSIYWLRDENGEIMRTPDGTPIVNILKPETQDLLVKRIIAYDRCGVLDGVFIDNIGNAGLKWKHYYPPGVAAEEIDQALINIFRRVRQQVREDFLIIINNRYKHTFFAEYLNGIFMETGRDYPGGYSRHRLIGIENTLTWAEKHLREPRINCLEAEGIPTEAGDSPSNLRWMRLFTTMSLTHSDGYVVYTISFRAGRNDSHHDHLWHDFWDANLGRPVEAKGQLYQNIDGLFIREFTNGWAVYNRSGKEQAITLPRSSIGVSSNKQDITHMLPDLDGEIYLTSKSFADVNGDGHVNILDLIEVTNSLGKSAPDPNGDGVVNILDLVFVAEQLSQ